MFVQKGVCSFPILDTTTKLANTFIHVWESKRSAFRLN